MKLKIPERLLLLGILPAEGTYVTLKIVRQLREELSFCEEEIKSVNIRQEGNQVLWDLESDPLKDVVIGEKAYDLISSTLKELEGNKKLTAQIMPLYEYFVLGEGEDNG